MATFRYLHAADLHLDSPLIGLARRSADFAGVLAEASRLALDNLVNFAIDERCSFVLLAGDVFDGDLRDVRSGLHFAKRLRDLKSAGIDVFMVLGNHDAENRFVSRITFSDNVHIFSTKVAESKTIPELDVVVHGQSFPRRDVTENIAASYPSPVAGLFNIGVLHTACQGREEHHAPYAPCSVEQLVNHGYDYWALGHVHNRSVLSEDPWVVYPGNLQGRHPKETGSKGATLVEVVDGKIASVEHRELDAVRWETVEVVAAKTDARDEILQRFRDALSPIAIAAAGRPLAVRLRVSGETVAHDFLTADGEGFRQDIEALLATLPGEFWLERLESNTRRPSQGDAIDPSVSGKLAIEMAKLRNDPAFTALLQSKIAEISAKMPSCAHPDELFERLRTELPDRSLDLALSFLTEPEDADAVR